MPLIPSVLTNFKAYAGVDSIEQIGLTDVELPSFEAMTETISGAGIAGEYESPVLGHFQSQTVKLKWRTTTLQLTSLLAQVLHGIDLRGSVQIMDAAAGQIVTQAVRVSVRGQLKMLNPGKFEPGKAMEAESEIEVASIIISIANAPVVEFDKFNSVFKVNGVDYLRQMRVDLGGA